MSSWFGSRSSSTSNVPAASSIQKQKHKQIESLREQVTNVAEIRRDELYRVIFNVRGNMITLEIKLPQNFPLTDHSPIVTVSPPMRHPWINEQMIVDGSPLIMNFTIHSNLGRAIQQIIKEFNDHPPEILTSLPPRPPLPTASPSTLPQSESSSFYMPMPPNVATPYAPFVYSSAPHTVANDGVSTTTDVARARRPAPPAPVSAPARKYQPPPLPDRLEYVRQANQEELERYLSEEEGTFLVDQYVSQMDVIKKVQVDRDNLFADNEDQAGINLRHEPDMQDSWTQLQENFLQLQTLKSEYDGLLDEQKQLSERYQRKNVVSRLKTLTQEAETESEIIADDFLDSKLSLTDFIQKFKQQRVLHHIRKSKHEKLTYSNTSRSDIRYT